MFRCMKDADKMWSVIYNHISYAEPYCFNSLGYCDYAN